MTLFKKAITETTKRWSAPGLNDTRLSSSHLALELHRAHITYNRSSSACVSDCRSARCNRTRLPWPHSACDTVCASRPRRDLPSGSELLTCVLSAAIRVMHQRIGLPLRPIAITRASVRLAADASKGRFRAFGATALACRSPGSGRRRRRRGRALRACSCINRSIRCRSHDSHQHYLDLGWLKNVLPSLHAPSKHLTQWLRN